MNDEFDTVIEQRNRYYDELQELVTVNAKTLAAYEMFERKMRAIGATMTSMTDPHVRRIGLYVTEALQQLDKDLSDIEKESL